MTSVQFAHGDELIAMYASSSRFPSDLFVASPQMDGSPLRLTDSLNANIDAAHLVDAEVVRFVSYDGIEVPGVLWVPHGANSDNPAPALVWVHGGPGGQTGDL